MIRALRATRSPYIAMTIALFFLVSAPAQEPQEEEESEPFETVQKYFYGGIREKQNEVITNREEWKNLWKQVYQGSSPRPALPEIDFTQRMVIAVFQGEQADSRNRISITALVKIGKEIHVSIKETIGNPECPPGPPVAVQPFHIIETERIKKPKKRVRFEEPQRETQKC